VTLVHSNDTICHTVSNWVDVPAETALTYIADAVRQGEWTLGSLNRGVIEERPDGRLCVGRSIMDGHACYVMQRPNFDDLICLSDVGDAPDQLKRGEVMTRVLRGEDWGGTPDQCIVTLMIWRPKGIDDFTWARECQMFNTEIFIIKGRFEKTYDPFEPVAGATYETVSA
jgi:hypothetical protein